MITLTMLKGEKFILNADEILSITQRGDTIVTCNNGHIVRVSETPNEVLDLVLRWQQQRWIPMVNLEGIQSDKK